MSNNVPGDLNVANKDGDTALSIAVDGKDVDVILRLINAGASLEYFGQESSLVKIAISQRNLITLGILLEGRVTMDGTIFFALQDESVENDHLLTEMLPGLLEDGGKTAEIQDADNVLIHP